MTRHSLAHDDAALDAVLTEAASGPVELVRGGEPVGVVLSMADYQRLTAKSRTGFFAALDRFRAEHRADDLDFDALIAGVRDREAVAHLEVRKNRR
jgi:prevent-host-death family protein